MRLNTNIPGAVLVTEHRAEDPGSPRTKVAYNFQGLQLEDASTVSKLDLRRSHAPKLTPCDEQESVVRKRVKVLGGKDIRGDLLGKEEIPETPQQQNGGNRERSFQIAIGKERVIDPLLAEKARAVTLRNEVDPVIFNSGVGKLKSGLGRSYPSINRLQDSKSRGRKRMGTPPLFGSAEASLEIEGDEEGRVIDEDRARLTWHDDEITGYSIEDPDDDGEGINGIGFKPTPAMAYARTAKRRAQMEEYRNREAREARAKRSERRRGNESVKSREEEIERERRVRFRESLVETVIPTD
jgi:hypothetical protein